MSDMYLLVCTYRENETGTDKACENGDDYLKVSFILKTNNIALVGTGRKLNVHKMLRRRPGRLLNVLCRFNLRPVSTGAHIKSNKQTY